MPERISGFAYKRQEAICSGQLPSSAGRQLRPAAQASSPAAQGGSPQAGLRPRLDTSRITTEARRKQDCDQGSSEPPEPPPEPPESPPEPPRGRSRLSPPKPEPEPPEPPGERRSARASHSLTALKLHSKLGHLGSILGRPLSLRYLTKTTPWGRHKRHSTNAPLLRYPMVTREGS